MGSGPRVKMVVGALIALLGIWWYIPNGGLNSALTSVSTLTNVESLLSLFQGSFGILIVFVGIFVVWIQHDELKMRREMEDRQFGETLQGDTQTVTTAGGDTAAENGDNGADD